MARVERRPHVHRFADEADFNEQLYRAIRQAPWVMTSIALHAVLILSFVLLSSAPEAVADATEPLRIGPVVDQPPPEEDPPETDEPTEQVHATDLVVPEPLITDAELAETNETDNDLPDEQVYGNGEGISDGAFEGPGNVGVIGISGGGGGSPLGLGGRRERRKGGGGTPAARTDDAVEHALRWLAAHQSPDGRWESGGFDQWCDGRPAAAERRPDGLGKPMYDVGVTGLALCAFLGAGYTSRGEHAFARVVRRGLAYLKNVQDPEGCFGPRTTQHYIYNHATAALAMVEGYGMTGSGLYKTSAQKALDFIALSRNPYFAWRYGVKPGDNDTSVTGWMMMALKSAKLVNADEAARGRPAPLQIDDEAFEGIRSWVDKMTDKDYGRVGYLQAGSGPARPQETLAAFPPERSEAMTAAGLVIRAHTGESPGSGPYRKGMALLLRRPPVWNPGDGSIDMYYWYFGTLAAYHAGGEAWIAWNRALRAAVLPSQRLDGDSPTTRGSWDAVDPWGAEGGPVYATAMMALCLELSDRYERVPGR